jgi:hypothetical protein
MESKTAIQTKSKREDNARSTWCGVTPIPFPSSLIVSRRAFCSLAISRTLPSSHRPLLSRGVEAVVLSDWQDIGATRLQSAKRSHRNITEHSKVMKS